MPDLRRMNHAQREAVTWGEGPLLLLAGPGSGKTFTITNRILYLLEQGVPPEKILVITFTKEAAVSMQRRFRRMSDKFYPVNFGTFHSVFYHILQESGGFRHLKLLSDSEKKNLLFPILKQFARQSEETTLQAQFREDAAKILAAISFYKNTGEPDRAASKMPLCWRDSFREIFAAYCGAAQRAEGMDFDDMLFACRQMLERREDVRNYWQNRFSHLLIDEFQDINFTQYEIIRLLAPKHHSIFAVGDDDQSIYGFRGSRPDIMRRFTEEFGAGRLLLNLNYRCRKEIIDASLAVISENRERFPKKLQAAQRVQGVGNAQADESVQSSLHVQQDVRGVRQDAVVGDTAGTGESAVTVRAFRDREEESGYLAERLRKWRERHGEDEERCAVLFRTNASMQAAAVRLRRGGIPFLMKERPKSIYEHFIVKDIMAYLLLAQGDWKREHFLRIMNRPVRYIGREAVGEGRTIKEMIQYYDDSCCTEEQRRRIQEGLELLQRQLVCLKTMPPGLAVTYILKAVNYESYLRTLAVGQRERSEEWEELLDWLKTDAAGFQSVKAWLEAQTAYTAGLGKRPRGSEEEGGEKIRLMTVHAAKGLEFHTVLIPDCNERMFPHGNMPDKEQVEEERRLFYVAMTRAKESLELLYLVGDSQRSRLPSRFLNPLLYSSPSLISSSNSQLSRYSSKASATLSYSSSSSI